MRSVFINREKEIASLRRGTEKEKFSLISVIGRRRIGKTALVRKALPDALYFYVFYGDDKMLKESFISALFECGIHISPFSSWKEIFERIMDSEAVVVIDEFQRFHRINPSVPSILQGVIDEKKDASRAKIILLGSSIGMMEKMFSYSGALYGRRNLSLYLGPLAFYHARRFFNLPPEESLKIYGVIGGTPGYLEQASDVDSAESLAKSIFSRESPLWEEPINAIRSELGESTVYFSILKALAEGRNSFSEMAAYVSIKPNTLDYYLENLEKNLAVIRKTFPFGTTSKRKRARYEISDNFFGFWFTFVYPFISDIEAGNPSKPLEHFRKNYNTYMGRVFEGAAREYFSSEFSVYRWWHRDAEVDMVLEKDGKLTLAEVKWTAVRNASPLCGKLREINEKYFDGGADVLIVAKKAGAGGSDCRIIELKDMF